MVLLEAAKKKSPIYKVDHQDHKPYSFHSFGRSAGYLYKTDIPQFKYTNDITERHGYRISLPYRVNMNIDITITPAKL